MIYEFVRMYVAQSLGICLQKSGDSHPDQDWNPDWEPGDRL